MLYVITLVNLIFIRLIACTSETLKPLIETLNYSHKHLEFQVPQVNHIISGILTDCFSFNKHEIYQMEPVAVSHSLYVFSRSGE